MDFNTFDHSQFYFVFGSNLAGRHGKGAALTAKRFYGAEEGIGEGLTGQCYALPTKDRSIQSRSISDVGNSITQFISVANDNPDKQFMVTRIGCGLAGFADEEIVKFFDIEYLPSNILLPGSWESLLNPELIPRIIIAGGRDFTNYNMLRKKCDHLLSQLSHTDKCIVSGTARGVDTMGEDYCKEKANETCGNWKLTRFPANWDRFGKVAGMLRNAAMAWYSTHLIAFWDGNSRGTKNMIDIADRDRLSKRVVKY